MKKSKEILTQKIREVEPEFAKIIKSIPLRNENIPENWLQLPPEWLHLEMIERYKILSHAGIEKGMNLLEIGAGAHAITTVPLAYMAGSSGRVISVEIKRWNYFEEIVKAAGLEKRIIPLSCDATHLPFPFQCFDMAVLIHGIRSMRSEETIIKILKEMLRVSSRVFIAESLPIAKNKAQEAHLEMYNLKEEIFEALYGKKDDIHYFPLNKLIEFVEKAGGKVIDSKILDVNLPHYLAFLPKEYIERIPNENKRENLIKRWNIAYEKLVKYGEEHPPVGILNAVRSEKNEN